MLSVPSSLVPASLRELELELQLPNTVRNVRNNQPEVGRLEIRTDNDPCEDFTITLKARLLLCDRETSRSFAALIH